MKHHDLILILCNEGTLVMKGDGTTFHPRDPRVPVKASRLTGKALSIMKGKNSDYCFVDVEGGNIKIASKQGLENLCKKIFPHKKAEEEHSIFPKTLYSLSSGNPGQILRRAQNSPLMTLDNMPLFSSLLSFSACMREARENYWEEVLKQGKGPSFPSLKSFIWKHFDNNPDMLRCRLSSSYDERFDIIEENWKNVVSESLYGGALRHKDGLHVLERIVLSIKEAGDIRQRLKELYRDVPDEIRFFTSLKPSDLAGASFEPEVLKAMNPLVLREIYSEFILDNKSTREILEKVKRHERKSVANLSFEQTCSILADEEVSPEDKAWVSALSQ